MDFPKARKDSIIEIVAMSDSSSSSDDISSSSNQKSSNSTTFPDDININHCLLNHKDHMNHWQFFDATMISDTNNKNRISLNNDTNNKDGTSLNNDTNNKDGISLNNVIVKSPSNNYDKVQFKPKKESSTDIKIISETIKDNDNKNENSIQSTLINNNPIITDVGYMSEFIQRRQRIEKLELLRREEEKEKIKKMEKTLAYLVNKSKFYSNKLSTDKMELRTNRKRSLKVEENMEHSKKIKMKDGEPSQINNLAPGLSINVNDSIHTTAKTFKQSSWFKGTLYPFQKEGVKWLLSLQENGVNGILADEMGLGKTIQTIALIAHMLEQNYTDGTYMVVAPLSTIFNWELEFNRFTPSLKVIIIHGSEVDRKNQMLKAKRKYKLPSGIMTYPIILTTYELVLREHKFFSKIDYEHVILDEGQRVKNPEAMILNVVKKLKTKNRLILTGTPLQNNLLELWSLLNFLHPEIFNDREVFVSWFNVRELVSDTGRKNFLQVEKTSNVIGSLREVLRPFMLRRLKDEVNLKIPPKKEMLVYCPMSEIQHTLYRAVLQRDLMATTQNLITTNPEMPVIMNSTNTRPLRKCRAIKECPDYAKRHDLLMIQHQFEGFASIDTSNMHYFKKMIVPFKMVNYRKIVNHPYLLVSPDRITEDIVFQSGKLRILDRLLDKLYKGGHKVLLFSCWKLILDVIEDYLTLRPQYKYFRMDGDTKVEDRSISIQEFNRNKDIFLFLLTTRSGGVGLNLMGADTVIIYDPDWNPQVDNQAMARCHRIGQPRPVIIYKLCTKNTIDQEILDCGEAKMKLEKAVIADAGWTSNFNMKCPENLQNLIDILEQNDNVVVKFDEQAITEEELDKLLDRSDMINMMKQASTN